MQLLFFAVSFFAAWSSFAVENSLTPPAPLPAGIFQFRGDFKIETSVVQELVDRKTPGGEKRFQDLVGQSYDCSMKSNLVYLCKKMIKLESTDALVKKINNKYFQKEITVGNAVTMPQYVDTNDQTVKWHVIQPVLFLETSFQDYHLVQKPNYLGAWFRSPSSENAVEIKSEHELQQSDVFWISKGNVQNVYYVRILFTSNRGQRCENLL